MLMLRTRSRGTGVGQADVQQMPQSGAIVNLNPIMGERKARLKFGQQVRVNLPKEWRLSQSMSDDPSAPPLLPVRGEDGGFQFRTVSVGRQQIIFVGDGKTVPLDFEVIIDAPQASAAGLRWPSRR